MAEATTTAPEATNAPAVKQTFIWGVGRRKSAVARVRVAPGTGKIEINGRELNDYLTAERDRKAIFGPLEVALRNGGFLTRDSRMKERKKYGQRGARRRFQFSKR